MDEAQRSAHGGQLDLGAVEELDHTLACDVILQQVAGQHTAPKKIALHALLRTGALLEAVQGFEKRHAHARVLRWIGHDDVGTHVGVGVVGANSRKDFAQRDVAASAINLADVWKDGVAHAIGDSVGRGGAAALGHVCHDGGFEQDDIAGLDGHGGDPLRQ